MKAAVCVFPGSNCDHDCYHVLKHVIGIDTTFVWHRERDLSGYDLIVVPGGFTYGDYLRTGAMAKLSPIMEGIREAGKRGVPIIGICNGFQILIEGGLLPGALIANESLKFICSYVHIRVESTDTPFTQGIEGGTVLKIPIAHYQGNYFAREDDIKRLEDNGQVVFRYCDGNGVVTPESNPNGSIGNIAGVCNREKNILGMMPHPERCAEPELGSTDGRLLFESVIKFLSG